ncbi:MAG: hypothetical protein AAGB35_00525 [Pseudomonadota bacterium]
MGACILCGKSAGFFYSLHKSCYELYQASEGELTKIIKEQLGQSTYTQLAEMLQIHVANYGFTKEASQRTLIRALESFSNENLEKIPDQSYSDWLMLLKELMLDESLFINKNFIIQQESHFIIKSIRNGILPASNANSANFSVELSSNEVMRWCFSSCHVEQIKPKQEQANWSVIKQIIDNTLPSKRKNLFESNEIGEGKIWLTNLCIYYESNDGVNAIEYKNIYSCTPIKSGIKLQSKELQSRPQCFYCEDGILLFEFIQYALKT